MTSAARLAACIGGAAWLGALGGWTLHERGVVIVATCGAAVVFGSIRMRPTAGVMVATVAVAAACSGMLAASRHGATLRASVPEGWVAIAGTVADQPVERFGDTWVVLRAVRLVSGQGPLAPIAIVWTDAPVPAPGDRVVAEGRLASRPDTIRGDPVAGRLSAVRARITKRASGPFHRSAEVVRSRVDATFGTSHRQVDALLAGFLVGETSGLDPERIDALRAAGLSHFVAVSGSNVALFLGAWWLVFAPLAGPHARAVIGLVGLVLFVVVTRWEPSVLRAAVMLGLVLIGRIGGIPIEPVVALGWGTAGLLLVSGDLAASVGFQLSVAATVGVMIGVRAAAARRPRWVWAVVGATAGAQLAVAPIVLFHFETIPLMAPLANLVAAPLVTLATLLGGLAVLLGGGVALVLARLAAGAVLHVAEVAAGWPQLSAGAFSVVVAVGTLGVVNRRVRLAAAGAVVASLVVLSLPVAGHEGATLTVLDVGQGDAIVIRDGDAAMLIDGGRDPAALSAALGRHGMRSIDVLVVTHGDADHAGGLAGLVDRVDIDEVWIPAFGIAGDLMESVVIDAEAAGARVTRVAAGATVDIGRVRVSAVGPLRRYQSDNDGAIVLWVDTGRSSVLLPSDIEAVAQAELPSLRPDVMLVPHHGSRTSDPEWLAATIGSLAIVSVGPNRYGHPDPDIVDLVRSAGASVRMTSVDGDVVVPLLPP